MTEQELAASFLCRTTDLDRTGARGVTLGARPNVRDIVVVRDGSTIRAYENRCPHLGTTLETVPDRFLDAEKSHLVCTVHGARFRVADGVCVWGPCYGDALRPVAVVLEGDVVRLAAD